jgi:hypothetical protein
MSLIWQVDGFLNQQETIIPKGFIRGYSIIIQAEAWRFSIIFNVDQVFKIKWRGYKSDFK